MTEGDGLQVKAGGPSFGGISALVTDGMGNPIPQAKVTFRLPAAGPTGIFPNGTRSEDQISDAQGKVSTWGIRWGTQPGDCHVAITAQHGGASAGTTARIRIVAAAQTTPAPVASFEVEVAKPPPAPPPPEEPAPDRPSTSAAAPDKRPGVLLTRTEGGEERISGGRAKWIVITLAAAGAVGGFAAYRLNGKRPAPTAPVATGPVLTLSVPTITIGKP